MENIFIVGFKSSGKTKTGQIIAYKKSYKFLDTDLELLKKFNENDIYTLFNKLGDDIFRKEEAHILKEILKVKSNKVISLGGGTLFNKYVNVDDIKNNGKIIFIDSPLDIIKERLKSTKSIYSKYNDRDMENIYLKRYKFFKNISNSIIQSKPSGGYDV